MFMKSLTHYSLLAVAMLLFFAGCKKENTINNGSVLQTPYALYFTDSSGSMYKTNDGNTYSVVFVSDGYPSRAVITYNENIIWAKPDLYLSYNNGRNFNGCFDKLPSIAKTAVNGHKVDHNQSMLFYSEKFKQAYVASRDPNSQNIFGIAYNNKEGAINFWNPDDYWDTVQIVTPNNISTTSFTQTKAGNLIAFDGHHRRFFYRPEFLTRWKEAFTSSANQLPDTILSFFSIGHINERVIAIDNLGSTGPYYTDDTGKKWFPMSGIPPNTPQMCVASPFEELCFVGTDGKGLYVLNPNTLTFQAANVGLPGNCAVRNIAFKENVYKNGTRQQFVFAATNQGLYRSADKGNTWVKTIEGNFINAY
jgi:hypothetical protein